MPSVVTLFYFLLFSVQHLSYGQQFVPFQSMKYFIEKEYAVTSYSEAEESCQNKSANLAVVNSQKIQEFLVQKINFSELQSKYKLELRLNVTTGTAATQVLTFCIIIEKLMCCYKLRFYEREIFIYFKFC